MEHLPVGTNEEIRFILGNAEAIRQLFLDDYCQIAARWGQDPDFEDVVLASVQDSEGQSSPTSDQLYNTLVRRERLTVEMQDSFNQEWQSMYLREERVEEIWRCYRCLPIDLRLIVKELEILKIPTKELCEKYHCSASTLYRKRDRALNLIRKNYFEGGNENE